MGRDPAGITQKPPHRLGPRMAPEWTRHPPSEAADENNRAPERRARRMVSSSTLSQLPCTVCGGSYNDHDDLAAQPQKIRPSLRWAGGGAKRRLPRAGVDITDRDLNTVHPGRDRKGIPHTGVPRIGTTAAHTHAGTWDTASMLLPSGSITKAP